MTSLQDLTLWKLLPHHIDLSKCVLISQQRGKWGKHTISIFSWCTILQSVSFHRPNSNWSDASMGHINIGACVLLYITVILCLVPVRKLKPCLCASVHIFFHFIMEMDTSTLLYLHFSFKGCVHNLCTDKCIAYISDCDKTFHLHP